MIVRIYRLVPHASRFVGLSLLISTIWLLQLSSTIAAPALQGSDIAIISTPASNAVVRGTIDISGSADYPTFQFFIVEFSPEPVSGNQWQIIGEVSETPVINGRLVTWNTTQVPDGSYTLRLRVVRLDGNYSEFFSQQVVVANAQPLPTDTPTATPEEDEAPETPPTVTPTPLPPTASIIIEQPVVDTPTPRPVATLPPLEDPDETTSFIPTISGFSMTPLRSACLYGGGLMMSLFVFFGFLSALRLLILGFMNRRRQS